VRGPGNLRCYEREIRAAAGILFLADFLVRVGVSPRFSPTLVLVVSIALVAAAAVTLTETLSAKPRPLFAPEATD